MFRRVGRLSLLAVSLLLMLALVACGSADPTNTPTPTEVQNTPTPTATTNPGDPTPTPGDPTPTPTTSPSFDAEEYFSGETIRIIVGFNPGGGTDTHSRYIAGNMSEFIPGNPRIIVSNLTPNTAAQNLVWDTEPNGLTWSYNPSPHISGAEDPAANYVASEFITIGAALRYDAIWLANPDLPYGDISDAIGATDDPLVMADSVGSPGELTSQNTFPAMMLADFLELPFDFHVIASTGTSQALLDYERGDINSIVRSSNLWYQMPLLREGWIADGEISPFASLATDGSVPTPNSEGEFTAPNVLGLLDEDELETWESVVTPTHYLSRILTTSPGVDPDVVAALRQAWDDALADPDFRAGYEDLLGQPIAVTQSGAELQEQTATMEQRFKDNLDVVDQLREEYYDRFVN